MGHATANELIKMAGTLVPTLATVFVPSLLIWKSNVYRHC